MSSFVHIQWSPLHTLVNEYHWAVPAQVGMVTGAMSIQSHTHSYGHMVIWSYV